MSTPVQDPIPRRFRREKKRKGAVPGGDVAARLAHELRNPLASIRMACRNLQHDTREHELKARIGQIIEEVDRLMQTLDGHLTRARDVAEPARLVRVAALLEDMQYLTRLQVPQAIRISVSVPDGLVCVLPEMGLRQALWNLLTNAWQAIGGKDGEIRICARPVPGAVCITVVDTGEGLPDAVLRALRTERVTSKADGTGLGLVQVRRYVEELGGELVLANRSAGGAEVTLVLPCEVS